MTIGYVLEDTHKFANNFYKVMAESLGMSRDVKAEEFEIEDENGQTESPIVTGDDVSSEKDAGNFDTETDI